MVFLFYLVQGCLPAFHRLGCHLVTFFCCRLYFFYLCLCHSDHHILCKHYSWTHLSCMVQVGTIMFFLSLLKNLCLVFIFPSVILSIVQFDYVCLAGWKLGGWGARRGVVGGSWESRQTLQRAGGRFQTQVVWLGVRGCTVRYCWSAHPEACLSSSRADTMQHQRGGRRREGRRRGEANSWDNHALYTILPCGRSLNERALRFSGFHLAVCWAQALCCISISFNF